MSVIATCIVLLLVSMFRPKLRRMEVERGIALKRSTDDKGKGTIEDILQIFGGLMSSTVVG
jgi:hypothetical protein